MATSTVPIKQKNPHARPLQDKKINAMLFDGESERRMMRKKKMKSVYDVRANKDDLEEKTVITLKKE
ncbi:hypothetical protein HDU92_006239 [Lobulomyces angularis]|nr:hypothetical protein HDU92_006239 [Lobulomyces angularis]